MTPDLLRSATGLFTGIFVLGTLLCLGLYRWQYRRFFASPLWTKVWFWGPIFGIFVGLLYGGVLAAVALVVAVAALSAHEVVRRATRSLVAWLYATVVVIAMAHLILIFIGYDDRTAAGIIIAIGFASVLSDVAAYFCGSFMGRHGLPRWINAGKSWEGVAGQLMGALIGYALIAPSLHPAPGIGLAVVVGLASATGDLTNSVVKRRAGIKDWGATIPGHGGVLDRCASLSFAAASGYWWLLLS